MIDENGRRSEEAVQDTFLRRFTEAYRRTDIAHFLKAVQPVGVFDRSSWTGPDPRTHERSRNRPSGPHGPRCESCDSQGQKTRGPQDHLTVPPSALGGKLRGRR